MWNPWFFLFLYPYPVGTAFESIENLFFCMNRYYYIPIPSRYLPRKIPNWIITNWRVSVSLSMRLCTLRIGIHFLKDSDFRALVGLRDPFDDLCCVEGISIWSDRLRKARGNKRTGESIQKRQFFSIILVFSIRLVLVSDPGSASPFFRDELLAPALHFFCLCGPRRRGARREEDCTMREGRRAPSFKYTYTTRILAMQCSWTLMSIRMEWIIPSA